MPTVDIWTGASSNLWSDNGNWQDNSAPTAGEDLVFPSGASNKTSIYDSGLGVSSFGSIAIQSGGYDISSSFPSSLTLTTGLSATYGSAISNFDIGFDPGNGSVIVGPGGTIELGGVISGTSGLAVSGSGAIQLGGTSSNTYSGTTTVANATTLLLDKSGATAIPGNLTINAGGTVQLAQSDQITNSSLVTEGSGATLDLNHFNEAVGALNLTGAVVSTGTGTLTLGGNVTTNSDSNTSVISGHLDLGGATRAFTVGNNAQLDPDLSITANISGTGAGLTKLGANSQLKLSGNNTYDGTTTIAAGAIEIASDNALGATSAGTVVNSGFSLALLGGITVPEPMTINGAGFGGLGAIFNGSGTNTISGAITLGAASTLGSLSGTLTFSGAISDGASSFALTKVCAGTVALTSANTYDGGTTITNGLNGSGVLAISNGSALGTGSVSISNGSELDLSNNITLSRNISFQGTGVSGNGALRSVSGNNTYSGTATVQANNSRIKVDAGRLTLSGDLTDGSNNYGVDKDGTGVLLVTGSLTSTLILHSVVGDLRITGSDSSVVTLYGGTISGTGTAGGLDHAGGSSGTVDPGTGSGTTGTLTTSGGYQVGTGGTTHIDIGGTTAGSTYDQVVNTTSGSVDITGSTIDPVLVNGFIPAVGDVFTVIDKQNSGAVTGTFLNLVEGATFPSGIVTYEVSYTGGNGNDVTLEVVSVIYTWTGLGGDNNWSTAANWDANLAPSGGQALVFPSGAARMSNNNDLSGKSFSSIKIAGGYDINGNAITLTNGISYTDTSNASEFHPNITLTVTETVDVADGGDFILSGAISGSGFGLTKTGGGTLEYTGFSANTYTGTTTVSGGTLILNRASGQNAIAGNLVIGDNIGGGESVQIGSNNQVADGSSVTVNEGASFDLSSSTETIAALTLQGASVTISPGGILTPTSLTTNATTNNVTSTISGAGFLDLGGNSTFAMTIADDTSVPVDLRISAPIQDGGLIKNGSGTLALSASNTYGGNTAVSSGVLQVESGSALGSTGAGTTVASDASVYFSGTGLSVSEDFTDVTGIGLGGSGLFWVVSGDATLTGSVTMSFNIRIGAASGSTLTIDGAIGDAGTNRAIDAISGATGRVVLGGSNTFGNVVYVYSGFLRITSDNALGDPASPSLVAIQSGTSLELSGGITIPSTKTIAISGVPVADSSKIISVSGNNTIQGDIGVTGGNNWAFDVVNGTTLTVSGVISGSRDFDKNNTGTLILTGMNTNTGNVNVGDGTLIVNGSLATSNGVSSDGVVGGSGTTSAVTISSIGTLAPGNSPGILHTGDLTFSDGGSTYRVEINGTTVGSQYDQVDVVGAVNLTGATLALSIGFTPTISTAFTLINNDGADAVGGTFAGLPEGSTLTFGSTTFTISYVGGTGNDVVLTSVAIVASPATLVTPTAGSVYAQQVTASGGSGTGYVFTATGLPAGLSMNAAGLITGTPTTANAVPALIQVTIVDSLGASTTNTYLVPVNPAIVALPPTLNTPIAGTPFSQQVTASGGSGGVYTFSATGLPPGLSISSGGLITGTPTNTATTTVEVTITDGNGASIIQTYSITANRASSTASLTTSSGTSAYGQSVILTATLTSNASGIGLPTGTVQFFSGSTLLGVGTLDEQGVATLATTALGVGSNAITTMYLGDGNHVGSTSPAVTVEITPSQSNAGSITASEPQVFYGEEVALTATFSATAVGDAPMTGTVSFYDGDVFLGMVDLLSQSSGNLLVAALTMPGTGSGQATLPTTALAVGSHVIRAVYSGDANYTSAASQTPVSVQVAPTITSTTLTTATTSQGTTLTAVVVVTSPGDPTVEGSVSFFDGTTLLGTVPVAGGSASLNIGRPTPGPHAYHATFLSGSSSAGGSTGALNSATTTTGVVYLDTNANGVLDSGEPGLAGRVVFLDQNGNGTLDPGEPTATTVADGSFSLPGASQGSAVIEAIDLDTYHRDVVAQSRSLADGSVTVGVVPFSPIAAVPVVPNPFVAAPPADANTAFVQSLYRAVLGRTGDDWEVQTWLDRIALGMNRAGVTQGFVNSPEHRRRQVEGFYRSFLGRSTDPFAQDWVNALLAGASEESVAEAILDSPEYQSAHQDPATLVRDLYLDVLGRQGEGSGVADFEAKLASGSSRASIVTQFVRSEEAVDQILDGFYSSYLRRGRDSFSAGWANSLNAPTGSATPVAIGLLASDEFFNSATRGRG